MGVSLRAHLDNGECGWSERTMKGEWKGQAGIRMAWSSGHTAPMPPGPLPNPSTTPSTTPVIIG